MTKQPTGLDRCLRWCLAAIAGSILWVTGGEQGVGGEATVALSARTHICTAAQASARAQAQNWVDALAGPALQADVDAAARTFQELQIKYMGIAARQDMLERQWAMLQATIGGGYPDGTAKGELSLVQDKLQAAADTLGKNNARIKQILAEADAFTIEKDRLTRGEKLIDPTKEDELEAAIKRLHAEADALNIANASLDREIADGPGELASARERSTVRLQDLLAAQEREIDAAAQAASEVKVEFTSANLELIAAEARQRAVQHLHFEGGDCAETPTPDKPAPPPKAPPETAASGGDWTARMAPIGGDTSGPSTPTNGLGAPTGGNGTSSNGTVPPNNGETPTGAPAGSTHHWTEPNEQVAGLPIIFTMTCNTGLGSMSVSGTARLRVIGSNATMTFDHDVQYEGRTETFYGEPIWHGKASGITITGANATAQNSAGQVDYTWEGTIAGGHASGTLTQTDPASKCTAQWNG